MKSTRFTKLTIRGAAAGLTLLAVLLIPGGSPAAAQNDRNDRNDRIHIVKDCSVESGIPGSDYCQVVSSNFPGLPAGTRIYYDLNPGPTAGAAGFFDQNIFVFVSDRQWAVGRCSGPNDINNNKPALCTLSDGMGPLAGFSARVVVTYRPGGNGYLYAWDGTYSYKSLAER